MMSYDEFKKVVEEKLKNYVPEPYKNMEWYTHKVEKVNETLDAISFHPLNESVKVTPTIYINTMYKQYKKGDAIENVLKDTAKVIIEAVNEKEKVIPRVDINSAKDNIVFQLINTEQNKEMLKNIPHRSFQDLSIIYRWIINRGEDGITSILIKNDIAKRLELNEEQLFGIASKNTEKILPLLIKPISELMKEIMIREGMLIELAEFTSKQYVNKNEMYVISNDIGMNGATAILYEKGLEQIANILESDVYIMPSSIHECIVISANEGSPNELAEMVESINMDKVELKDRLSNQVYFYNRETKHISIASNNPNKKLN